MEKYKRNKQHEVESVAESIYEFFEYGLDLCICFFMLLILVVMPFYNEEGYTHIGTDKATFLRQCIIYGGRVVIPLLCITVIMSLIVYIQNNGMPNWKEMTFKYIIAFFKKNLSVTDCFALLYGICVIFSYLFCNYKEEALWGTKGWYMGLKPQISAVVFYFLISRRWHQRTWMAALILPVSAVVFALGYLNRFGIYPINMESGTEAFISTIGNINWYCGYLVSVFFGGLFLFGNSEWKKDWMKYLFAGYVIIGFATLVTQGSSSGIFTMLAIFLVLFRMSASDGKRMENFWLAMVLLSATCLLTCLLRVTKVLQTTFIDSIVNALTYSVLPVIMLIVTVGFWWWVHDSNKKSRYPEKIFNRLTQIACGGALGLLGLYIVLLVVNTIGNGFISQMLGIPQNNFLMFNYSWGSSRGATLAAGWLCFWEQNWLHKLLGVGPDCMSAFLYTDGSDSLINIVNESFNGARLTNAHNEWLTILVNIGLLGLISYAGMMISAIRHYIQKANTNVIAAACGIGILAYTINNVFSFQQSMSLATIFVILGIGENYSRKGSK